MLAIAFRAGRFMPSSRDAENAITFLEVCRNRGAQSAERKSKNKKKNKQEKKQEKKRKGDILL